MTAWLDGKPPPDVRTLTDAELLALYHVSKNSDMYFAICDEGMRRLERREGERGKAQTGPPLSPFR